ncbi:MAG TPA: hypothetical protein VH439_07365 [Gemmatimonadales bacterium]
MRLRLALALIALASPVSAQTPAARLSGRVPAAAMPAIDSIIATAVVESLPTEPLVQKALEGSAKNVPPDRLVSGVRGTLVQLRAARMIVAQAMPGQPIQEGHVAAVAAALARGLPAPIVERLLTVAPHEPPGPALHAAADMIAHHFDPDSAVDLLVEAHSKGLRGMRLLDVAVAADHELQRGGGRTPSEALAHVRAMLPNVPATESGPTGAAVTRHGTKGS